MASPIIQATFQLLLFLAVIHLSTGGTHAAVKEKLDPISEGGLAQGTENTNWRMAREAGRKLANGRKNNKPSNNKSDKAKSFNKIRTKDGQEKSKSMKTKNKLKKEKKKPEKGKNKRRNLYQKKKKSKNKSRLYKIKGRQNKINLNRNSKKSLKDKKKDRQNKNKSKSNKRKPGQPPITSDQIGRKNNEDVKQTFDATVVLQTNKDNYRIGNNLKQSKRITKRCEQMDNKAKKASEFDATVAALNKTINFGSGVTEEIISIRDNLISCSSTVKENCQKLSVADCQNDELINKCEPELQSWIDKFHPSTGSCSKAAEGYYACISTLQAATDLSAECLQMTTLEKQVKESRSKCMGAFGNCRRLQRMVADTETGPANCPTSATLVTTADRPPFCRKGAIVHGPTCNDNCPSGSICCFEGVDPLGKECCHNGTQCKGPTLSTKPDTTTSTTTTTKTTANIITSPTDNATTPTSNNGQCPNASWPPFCHKEAAVHGPKCNDKCPSGSICCFESFGPFAKECCHNGTQCRGPTTTTKTATITTTAAIDAPGDDFPYCYRSNNCGIENICRLGYRCCFDNFCCLDYGGLCPETEQDALNSTFVAARIYSNTVEQGQHLEIWCSTGGSSQIHIIRALYTRVGDPHCTDPIKEDTSIVKNLCQYKPHCSVYASNGVFQDPCTGTVSKTLRIVWSCSGSTSIAAPTFEENEVPPEEFFTEEVNNNETATEDIIKLIHGACHSSHALARDGLAILNKSENISHSLLNQLKKESDIIISKNDEWICGIEHMLSLIKDEKTREEVKNILPQELQQHIVTRSQSEDEPHKRVIGGNPAPVGLAPWQGLIMRVFPYGKTSWATHCGCVLIHSCYVLTTRHCTAGIGNPSEDMRIILGDVDVPPPGPYSGTGQERQVMYVHYHPDPAYDVALILLKSSSSVDPTWYPIIKPIKIANFYPQSDSMATVSGFGRTTSSLGPPSPVLNFAEVKVPSFTTCQNYWPTIGADWLKLAAHEICAGGYDPYVGACVGDAGGPLTQMDPVTYEPKLIGLVSNGIYGCPPNMKYAIYVNPSFPAIKGWIDSILPPTEPTGNMGHDIGTGKPCACLRPAVDYTGQLINAAHFNNTDNRNCFLKYVNSSCGSGSPTVKINISSPWTAIASPYTCWANAGVPWSPNCRIQFPYKEKMYLDPWNPKDCPLELDPVPEYTHAYIATGPISQTGYYYGYANQEFTTDIALSAQGVPVCFSSLSMVTLHSGEKISVSQIKIGDILQAVDLNQKLVNSPFLGWLHKDSNTITVFLNIITEDNAFISLSPLHLILTTKSIDQKPTMMFAKSVSVGDYLVSPYSESLQRVVSISTDIRQGVYAPLTETGTILVDGLVASCYAHIQSHHLAHFGFLPVRIMPGLLEDRDSQYKDGMRTYLKYLMKLARPLIIDTKEEITVEDLSFNEVAAGFLTSLISIYYT